MRLKKTVIEGMEFNLPDYYDRLEADEDTPKGATPFGVRTDNAICYIMVSEIQDSELIPRDKKEAIKQIRDVIDSKQGIIQVETDEDYSFSIVKTATEKEGTQYTLVYQKTFEDGKNLNIQGFFIPTENYGVREGIIYEMLHAAKVVGNDEDPYYNWERDPYDKEWTKGVQMNKSEQLQYDQDFVGYPLTMCRELIDALTKKLNFASSK